MRTIKGIHQAVSSPIADLVTYRALPTRAIDHIDPFLFLNHHGYQVYPANNRGLPFGPHPHRGFETVTFILKGDLAHRDSSGNESVIGAGGVQWMTAGRGLIHAEVSSSDFKRHGGELEILQLWINLPAKYKMADPAYTGLQKDDIPVLELDEGRVHIDVVSGNWGGRKGAFSPLTDVQLAVVHFKPGGSYRKAVADQRNIFFYVVKGALEVNGRQAKMHDLVEFENDGTDLQVDALEEATLLLGHAQPFNEPIIAQGPFVMNTQDEIMQAYHDYENGVFGSWDN